ncbi:MAG: PH domain-containing protein [Promethearchaeota archaeon]
MEFQPDPQLQTKYFLQLFFIPLFLFLILVLPTALMYLLLFSVFPGFLWMWSSVLFWGFVICFIWTIPGLILIPLYYRRIHYVIHEDEVIVTRGLITITRRVVPIRAITNVSLRRGPFDRLLRIGSVTIETAGQMGARSGKPSPELALDGLVAYDKVNNQILELVRRYRAGYVLTTEIEPTPITDSSTLLQKILVELQKLNVNLEKSG